VLLYIFFGNALIEPNSYLFSVGGDGLKNYFTPAYYVKHNSGFQFTGMGHPFGEHVVYTDCQPLLSGMMQFIETNITPISHKTVGILNLLMMLSIPVCALFLFKILAHYKISVTLSIVFAIIIAFLSPQMHRMLGHYALAYCFYIPMIWYALIKVLTAKRIFLPSFILVIIIIVFSFIHPYYLALSLIFLGAFSLVEFFLGKKLSGVFIFLLTILPVIVFQVLMHFTDVVIDRPDNPYGIFTYIASIESVFLPNVGPIREFLFGNFAIRKPKWDGFAFIGSASLLVIVLALIRRVVSKVKKQQKQYLLPKPLFKVLLTGILVLLFSMAIPFKWGLDFFYDIVPPLKQFRGLGRFAWVFFYIGTISAVVIAHHYYKIWFAKNQLGAKVALLVFIALFATDAFFHSSYLGQQAQRRQLQAPLFTKFSETIASAGVKVDDYQAILVFPFFHIGSEEIYIDGDYHSHNVGFKAAYATGLPLVNTMMSRTSLSQTLASLNYANNIGNIDKKVSSGKPLLLLEVGEIENTHEKQIVKKATQIASFNDPVAHGTSLNIYSIGVDAFSNFKEVNDKYLSLVDSMLLKPIDKNLVGYGDPNVQFNFFGNQTAEQFSNTDSLFLDNEFFFKTNTNHNDTNYTNATVWVKASGERAAFPKIIAEVYQNEKVVYSDTYNPKWSRINYKGYVLATIDSIPLIGKQQLCLRLKSQNAVLNSILVQKCGTNVYSINDENSFMHNNHYYNQQFITY